MKKYILIFTPLLLVALTTAGCDGIQFLNDGRSKHDENTIIITPVDDPELAKLILKPNPKTVEIPRDPFKPIYGASGSTVNRMDPKKVMPIRAQFSDLYFIGLVKMDNEAIALMKLGQKKLMLKQHAQYKGYIVKEVTNKYVVFSDGETQITIKRGGKK